MKKILLQKKTYKQIDEVLIGRENEDIVTRKRTISYHEAGHCLMGYILKYTDSLLRLVLFLEARQR